MHLLVFAPSRKTAVSRNTYQATAQITVSQSYHNFLGGLGATIVEPQLGLNAHKYENMFVFGTVVRPVVEDRPTVWMLAPQPQQVSREFDTRHPQTYAQRPIIFSHGSIRFY